MRRLLHPEEVHSLGLVAVAALVGFVGNELVAGYRIQVGRRIGSAALVADGLHARTDGFTSLAVLLGARRRRPRHLLITVVILFVLRDAAREVYRRLMDAVDPDLLDQAETAIRQTPGVLDVGELRLRWIGHSLRAEVEIILNPTLTLLDAHRIAHEAEHRLLHDVPRLRAAQVHVGPEAEAAGDAHDLVAHHH